MHEEYYTSKLIFNNISEIRFFESCEPSSLKVFTVSSRALDVKQAARAKPLGSYVKTMGDNASSLSQFRYKFP